MIHLSLVHAIRKQLPDAVPQELTELIAQAAREATLFRVIFGGRPRLPAGRQERRYLG